jgi:hypothetical protein
MATRKIVRTEQIGPSGHKNDYHIGVLHGNWQEERYALGRKAQGRLRFEGESETVAAFAPGAGDGASPKPMRAFPAECPRELLFGQGAAATTMAPERQWLTTSQVAQANAAARSRSPAGASSGADPAAAASVGASFLRSVAGDKARRRQQELDDDETFATTKQQSIDALAQQRLAGGVASERRDARQRGGAITNTLHTAAHKMHLRSGH